MVRKKKSSLLEDIVSLLAMLPWWVGIGLAVIGYLVLHGIATKPLPAFTPSDMGGLIVTTWLRAVSMVAQFVLPALCVIGALISFLKRKKRQSLIASVTQSSAADSLEGMSWREFEILVGEAFRLQGYRVAEVGGAGADGGVDLVLNKGNEKFLVQCKQWKAYKVNVMVVRELYGVMAAKGAAGGFVVTSGRFTDDAIEFAAGRNIRLVDGLKLFGMIKQARNARVDSVPQLVGGPGAEPVRQPSTTCPACGAAMKVRVAKKGTNAGSEFWGCSTYPACRGTRAVA